jgi:hypothetical protein
VLAKISPIYITYLSAIFYVLGTVLVPYLLLVEFAKKSLFRVEHEFEADGSFTKKLDKSLL